MLARLRKPWTDRRAERTLGAVACLTALAIVLMVVFVAQRAWPTFSHEGLSWLGSGGSLDNQIGAMQSTSATPPASGGVRSEQLGLLGLSLGERCVGSVAQTAQSGSV